MYYICQVFILIINKPVPPPPPHIFSTAASVCVCCVCFERTDVICGTRAAPQKYKAENQSEEGMSAAFMRIAADKAVVLHQTSVYFPPSKLRTGVMQSITGTNSMHNV